MGFQERERVFLVAALALLGHTVPDTLVDVQGRVGYLLGGLAQEVFREEGVFVSAYDEGRRGDTAQVSCGVVAEVGIQRGEEMYAVVCRFPS
jgi:hypothetical protein